MCSHIIYVKTSPEQRELNLNPLKKIPKVVEIDGVLGGTRYDFAVKVDGVSEEELGEIENEIRSLFQVDNIDIYSCMK